MSVVKLVVSVIGLLLLIVGYSTSSPFYNSRNGLDKLIHPNQRSSTSSISPRIIGGQEATPHQFPYEVGLYITLASQSTFCGGSLISQQYVLTAAHCVQEALTIEARLGAHYIDQAESTQIRITTTNYVYHPEWNRTALINDIAIVNLNQNVTLNTNIQTVKIYTGTDTFAGATGTVAGWGKTTDSQSTVTPVLMYITNDILSNAACSAIEPFGDVVTANHMCLDGSNGKGICNGDSGGPLMADGVQVGVVSFGYYSCEQLMPQVFTRVSNYQDWIRSNSDIDY